MAFHLADVMASLLAGRFEAMLGDVSPTTPFDDERRSQKSVIRFQMEMLLTARQLQPVVDIIQVGVLVGLASSASPLASRRLVVVVFQVMANHLAARRHFTRHHHLVVA